MKLILKRHDSPACLRCCRVPRSSTKPAAPVMPIMAIGRRIDRCRHQSTATAVTITAGTQMMKPPNVGVPVFTWCEAGWYSLVTLPTFWERR